MLPNMIRQVAEFSGSLASAGASLCGCARFSLSPNAGQHGLSNVTADAITTSSAPDIGKFTSKPVTKVAENIAGGTIRQQIRKSLRVLRSVAAFGTVGRLVGNVSSNCRDGTGAGKIGVDHGEFGSISLLPGRRRGGHQPPQAAPCK